MSKFVRMEDGTYEKVSEIKNDFMSLEAYQIGEAAIDGLIYGLETENDPIHHPKHYQIDGVGEVKDIIKGVLGDEGYQAYCHGNIIKYILRANKKNGSEDLKKAREYINFILGE